MTQYGVPASITTGIKERIGVSTPLYDATWNVPTIALMPGTIAAQVSAKQAQYQALIICASNALDASALAASSTDPNSSLSLLVDGVSGILYKFDASDTTRRLYAKTLTGFDFVALLGYKDFPSASPFKLYFYADAVIPPSGVAIAEYTFPAYDRGTYLTWNSEQTPGAIAIYIPANADIGEVWLGTKQVPPSNFLAGFKQTPQMVGIRAQSMYGIKHFERLSYRENYDLAFNLYSRDDLQWFRDFADVYAGTYVCAVIDEEYCRIVRIPEDFTVDHERGEYYRTSWDDIETEPMQG